MKVFIDFLPLLVFFIAFKLQGIFAATAAIIVASLLQFAYLRATGGRISKLQLFSLALLLVLGGGALLFQDPRFLIFKPTLANCAFALAGLLSLRAGNTPAAQLLLVEALEEQAHSIPDSMFRRLTVQWVGFFLAEGVLNLVVAYTCSLSTWVTFKVFGLMGLSMVMMALQMVQLHPFLSEAPKPAAQEDCGSPS